MKNLEKIFREAYKKEWEKRAGTSPIRVIANEGTPYEKVYEEDGNFFLCGFIDITFSLTGKNKELKKKLEESGYEVKKHHYGKNSYWFGVVTACFNGDFLIGKVAYSKVADYLNDLGYSVSVNAVLD